MVHSFIQQAFIGVSPRPALSAGRTAMRKVKYSFEDGNLRLKEDIWKEKKQVILVVLIQKRIQVNINSNCKTSKVQI